MLMNEQVDEGKILFKESVIIEHSDDTLTLLKKITKLASTSFLDVIERFVAGSIYPVEQQHKFATYSKIIKKNHTYLDFNYSADHILGQIRAFNPNPGSKCFINGQLIKIIKAKKEFLSQNLVSPGTILDADKLLISCKFDGIRPTIIQRAGKKPLELSKALNGWKITPGTIVMSKLGKGTK